MGRAPEGGASLFVILLTRLTHVNGSAPELCKPHIHFEAVEHWHTSDHDPAVRRYPAGVPAEPARGSPAVALRIPLCGGFAQMLRNKKCT